MGRSALAKALVVAFVFALGMGAGGCTPELCVRDSDCAAGLVCTAERLCAAAPADAGSDGAPATSDTGEPVIEQGATDGGP